MLWYDPAGDGRSPLADQPEALARANGRSAAEEATPAGRLRQVGRRERFRGLHLVEWSIQAFPDRVILPPAGGQ
jgi:hypothetical protein